VGGGGGWGRGGEGGGGVKKKKQSPDRRLTARGKGVGTASSYNCEEFTGILNLTISVNV